MISAVQFSSLVRVSGRDIAAGQLLLEKKEAGLFDNIAEIKVGNPLEGDYAQIDLALDIAAPTLENPVTAPPPLVGYAGLTPQQRYRMVEWLDDPLGPAPNTIRQLYVCHLESSLFDDNARFVSAFGELERLVQSESWAENVDAHRAILLACWLKQQSEPYVRKIEQQQTPSSLLGVALGHLALLKQPLTPKMVQSLMQYWQLHGGAQPRQLPSLEILQLRLTSWATVVGSEPLQYALAQTAETEQKIQPWRCAHRHLRVSIPQPNLEPILRPLLDEALEGIVRSAAPPPPAAGLSSRGSREADAHVGNDSPPGITATGEDLFLGNEEDAVEEDDQLSEWALVLEFGQSRSEYFDFAIFRARQRPNYTQIMDEDRTLIHRIIFTKSEMRHFWVLWEYVQNWSTTHVYVNGKEIEKWKVWPYSQYLR